MEAGNVTGLDLAKLRNMSREENRTIIMAKVREFMNNRTIDDTALISLLFAYVLLILTGATGNGLVCLAVARKPQMRTARYFRNVTQFSTNNQERNVFIINLAISDLILCLFTMPFSLVEIVLKFWPLGLLTCKLVAGLQATSIFVSTISITAIALDRYKVIVYPTQESCKPLNAILTLTCIWVFALLLASPMFWFKSIDSYDMTVFMIPIEKVDYCLEKWPVQHGAGFYSIFTMLFQYVLPIVIVSVAYARISKKLRYRVVIKGTKLQDKQERDIRRMRRTNSLLIAIALIFVVSWLPLNILNILAEFYFPFDSSEYRILFACCHMIGMSSACSNPLLYGWLNDNFKKEFREIFSTCCCCSPERGGSSVTRGSKNGNRGAHNFARDKTESVIIVTKSTGVTDSNGTFKNNLAPIGVTEKFETIVITAPR